MFWLYALLGLAGVLVLAGTRKRRAACLLGTALVIVMLWCACGGGQSVHNSGTPAGTYTIDVTGSVTSTSSSAALTNDLKLTLTVD